jgi:hypothetical protein
VEKVGSRSPNNSLAPPQQVVATSAPCPAHQGIQVRVTDAIVDDQPGGRVMSGSS